MFMERARNRLTPPKRPDKMPCSRRAVFGAREYSGGVAQLGERVNGIHEVRGSIPLASTWSGGRTGRTVGPVRRWRGGRYPLVERLDLGGNAGIAQLVEHNLAKVGVAGSSPVSRSPKAACRSKHIDAGWSSLVARRAHNPEVVGSNPTPAITEKKRPRGREAEGT